MTPSEQQKVTWAHSVCNDKNSTEEEKRKALAVIAKLDPAAFDDFDGEDWGRSVRDASLDHPHY